MRRLLIAALFIASFVLPPSAAMAATQWVMGYYVVYQRDIYPPAKIGWDGLTHIVVGRLKVASDGTLLTDFDWDTTNGPVIVKDIAVRAHAAGKKAILMLGGAGEGAAIRSAVLNHRAAFVANLVEAMKTYGYDGLDLDWEDEVDWPAFVGFVRELRKAAPKAILTMPVGALNLNYQTVQPEIATMAASLDRLSIMSYYPSTAWAGSGWLSWFNSPLDGEKGATPVSIASSLEAYAAAGIPKAKLAMGASFYAICYSGGITGPNQSTETGVEIRGGDNDFPLSALYGRGGSYAPAYRKWYGPASEPYLSLPAPESHGCRYVSYEDEQSILAKGAFSRRHGYGGSIIWTINQGYVAAHPRPNFLLEAFGRGFLKPAAPATVAVSILQGSSWMKPGEIRRFSALVTGATETSVTWSVSGSGCGTIASTGVYRAPAAPASCAILAKSVADPAKSAKASVTVSDKTWTVGFSLARPTTWWVEVTARSTAVTAMSVRWSDGTTKPLQLLYRRGDNNYPVFAANYEFPATATTYLFEARAVTGRSAEARLKVPACAADASGNCQ